MNLILLSDPDFISPHRVRLSGRRSEHIQDILKAQSGKILTVGLLNGLIGQGTVLPMSFPRATASVGQYDRKRESILKINNYSHSNALFLNI